MKVHFRLSAVQIATIGSSDAIDLENDQIVYYKQLSVKQTNRQKIPPYDIIVSEHSIVSTWKVVLSFP